MSLIVHQGHKEQVAILPSNPLGWGSLLYSWVLTREFLDMRPGAQDPLKPWLCSRRLSEKSSVQGQRTSTAANWSLPGWKAGSWHGNHQEKESRVAHEANTECLGVSAEEDGEI